MLLALVTCLLIMMLILTGCSGLNETTTYPGGENGDHDNTHDNKDTRDVISFNSDNNTEDADNTDETSTADDTDGTYIGPMIREISRSSSGLDSVEALDFSKFIMNTRVSDILNNPDLYKDEDYKKGIVKGKDSVIISERFSEVIIEGIGIGTSNEIVKSTLGTPSFSLEDCFFYKTKEYYLGFKGKEKVELAIARILPKEYDPQVLKIILQELNSEEYVYLSESISQNKKISEFIDSNGHVHGGGWYAISNNGIYIEEFAGDDNITIYNNFEGELYEYESNYGRFKTIYKNEDYIVNELSYELNDHIYINRMFETNGVLSPGGKRKCIYQWLTSMVQHFTIRTMDYSKPDLKLSAMSSGFSWINDDYILYIHMIYGIPYIVRADEANKGQHINVLYKMGHIKEEYPVTMSVSDMDFTIKDVKDGVILLEDRKNQKEYEINYDFDDNGLIRLFGDQTEEDTTNVETQIGNTFGNIMNNGLVMQGRIYVPCRIIKKAGGLWP